jgi:hypothetical protein
MIAVVTIDLVAIHKYEIHVAGISSFNKLQKLALIYFFALQP